MPEEKSTAEIILTNEPIIGPQLDIATPLGVEVETNVERSIVWVNVDGVCRLRVCRIPKGKLTGIKVTGRHKE
jgi:hypothetical protein